LPPSSWETRSSHEAEPGRSPFPRLAGSASAGKFYPGSQYGVDEKTEMLDYGAVGEMAKKEKPQIIVCGASAYPRTIDFAAFQEIADDVGAVCMADIAHIAGLVATGLHPTSVAWSITPPTHPQDPPRAPRRASMCNADLGVAMDQAVFPGMQGGPLIHHNGKSMSVRRRPSGLRSGISNKQIVKNAKSLAETLMNNGLRLVSGGTDNHLMLLDLRSGHHRS